MKQWRAENTGFVRIFPVGRTFYQNLCVIFCFLKVIMILFLLLILLLLLKLAKKPELENLRELKLKLQPFSGLNRELYLRYVNNIELFGRTKDEEFLYKALENAQELQLYGTEDFQDVINKVAIEGERYIIKTNNSFAPRYLNDLEYFYSDVDDNNNN